MFQSIKTHIIFSLKRLINRIALISTKKLKLVTVMDLRLIHDGELLTRSVSLLNPILEIKNIKHDMTKLLNTNPNEDEVKEYLSFRVCDDFKNIEVKQSILTFDSISAHKSSFARFVLITKIESHDLIMTMTRTGELDITDLHQKRMFPYSCIQMAQSGLIIANSEIFSSDQDYATYCIKKQLGQLLHSPQDFHLYFD